MKYNMIYLESDSPQFFFWFILATKAFNRAAFSFFSTCNLVFFRLSNLVCNALFLVFFSGPLGIICYLQ